MIGLFDSGFGGLSVLKEFRKILPEYDYIYLADSGRAPYGNKSAEEILQFSIECAKFLFDKGAKIVIVACNTAMVHSIRILQNDIFPDRKILGVTIPGAEKVIELRLKKIGVLATYSTVKMKAYKERIHFIDNTIDIQEIAAPELVTMIESGLYDTKRFREILLNYLNKFDNDIEGLVIGCTHYSLIKDMISDIVGNKVIIIDPSVESAIKFKNYLNRHKEIDGLLLCNGRLEVYTSGETDTFKKIGKNLFEELKNIEVKKLTLTHLN